MLHHHIFKKFDSSLGVVACFSFSLCFFLLDYSNVTSNGSSEKVSFIEAGCHLFSGRWVWDESYPLYQSRDCMFLDEGFRCSENGRPGNFYTK